MMAEMICHKCNHRMRVDFRREFRRVRCDQCNTILERERPVDKAAKAVPAKPQVCPDCRGSGRKMYPDTTTYRSKPGMIAGQAFTEDVCNKCWGSGNHNKPNKPPKDADV